MADRGKFPVVLTVVVAIAFCVLMALGIWQVQRLKWKTELLAHIDALQSSPAAPIDVVLSRVRGGADADFTRVQVACPTLETTPVLRLFALYEGLAGYRLITACPLGGGGYSSVLVDRGFVALPGARQPKAIPGRVIAGPVVGVLRRPDGRNIATAPNEPGKDLWYWRDVPAMARALHVQRPAPLFLMLERPAPADMIPRPAPVPTNIPNNHLGYAVTWFGLAAALVGVYLAMLFRRRT